MTTDRWSEWLLHRRFGGDAAAAEKGMRHLRDVRDAVLGAARIAPGETVLDAGCGDGLIAFGALERVGATGHVIFCDVSAPLLERAAATARELGVHERCAFVEARAESLAQIADASVDAVTTRSVLIYVADKLGALREFHRVLRPGGRLALWEPINRFDIIYRRQPYWGREIEEIADLTARIREFYERLQPPDSDPMLDFDERDLLGYAEDAGFRRVKMQLTVTVQPAEPRDFDLVLDIAGNPNIPTQREAMAQIFTAEEFQRFERHVRPLIEAGGQPARGAVCLLSAAKGA
jgi:ubiquinone/menaquinone biosynthesis C-methylase UbiE